VSLLGAMSSNAISAGIGALWIIFAQAPWMLLFGYFVVGLTVGADVPASWTLITETAPAKIRGRLAGLAQVLWYTGAIAPLIIGIAFLGLGEWLPRVLFAQLFVVAIITWALRQGMVESELWAKAQKEAGQARVSSSRCFSAATSAL
jgi:inositol transporter-like SP family MFS transporter